MNTLLQNVDVDFDRGSRGLRLADSLKGRKAAMSFIQTLEVDPSTLI